MYDTIIAIDLETTGADPYTDSIIEIGAAVWKQGEIVERFCELVKPEKPLPPAIIKLTGITPAMTEDARPRDAVLDDFLDFLPRNALCIAHNASFERSFLRVHTKDRFKKTVLDTVELSRICFPLLNSHSLRVLTEELNLPQDDEHRALSDCETLLALWEKILAKAREIPLPIVSEMRYLLAANPKHPYNDFFQKLEQELLTAQFGASPETLESMIGKPVDSAEPPPPRDDLDDRKPPSLDIDEVAHIFEQDGLLERSLRDYEPRASQTRMAKTVARAFNEQKHLLVEAGTGTGKSLAYLAPAVKLATEHETPVVVSTNTKNLQSQLFEKDLPLLRMVLDAPFKAALLKGRRNYLCLRKLFYVLQQSDRELDREERMRMLNLLPWASWTRTGDIAENIVGDRPGFRPLWGKLCTVGEDCGGRSCRHHRRCFLRQARARAMAADIIVANHSLVFADVGNKNPALPPHLHLIFDEAHNLEDAATSHLSVEVSLSRITFPLNRLFRPSKRKNGTGLLMSVRHQLMGDACTADGELRDLAVQNLDEAILALEGIGTELKTFLSALEAVLKSRSERGPYRFAADQKTETIWAPVDTARQALVARLAAVIHSVDRVYDALKEMKPGEVPYYADFIRDLSAASLWVREATEDIEFVLAGDNAEYAYWIEQAPAKQGGVRALAAPVKVGQLLHDQVYAKKQTVVFCSATLTVRGKFDFLKSRLGIDCIEKQKLIELEAGTPFDYNTQCLALVPSFLPEPGDRNRNYTEELSILLSEVFRRTRGRAMALFTSYDMLKNAAATLQSEMLGDGIQVLAQGQSGSRETMTATFKRDIHSVLMGTHSFWEGVDVAGEALSCLVIARLPFAVFTDPIIQARCEQVEADGHNAFMGFSLPSAVIRFRQGFGRLIRHKTDRGIVIVTDRRMVSKRYGQWFRESIPAPFEVCTDREAFLDRIAEFLPDE